MLSRTKPAVGPGSGTSVSSAKDTKKKRKLPKLDDFLAARDFTGAMTLLEVSHQFYVSFVLYFERLTVGLCVAAVQGKSVF